LRHWQAGRKFDSWRRRRGTGALGTGLVCGRLLRHAACSYEVRGGYFMNQKSKLKRDANQKTDAKQAADPELQNEGEGSRSAARRYDAAVERMDPKRIEELAKKAEQALQGPEGDDLRKAEERGKRAIHR
jgi:hypothetical protein